MILFVERRIPQFLKEKIKILRVGKPGKELGLDDDRYYLVVSEEAEWHTDKKSKRLRNIFRHAIIRVALEFLRRKVAAKNAEAKGDGKVSPDLTTTVKSIKSTKKQQASEIITGFDIVQSRMKVMDALRGSADPSDRSNENIPDEIAEKLVDIYETVGFSTP